MQLTPTEIARLRKDGQASSLYLAVAQYATVYTARLASLPTGHSDTSTDMVTEIVVTGGSGTLADIKEGMTLYVGTASCAYDLGMCRIREAPSTTTWKLGETSEINWAETVTGGLYLTVVNDFGLWAKPLKIVDETVYMDVDIAYSDQHELFAPVPVMGSHWAKFIDEPETETVIYDDPNAAFTYGSGWVNEVRAQFYGGSSHESPDAGKTATFEFNGVGFQFVFTKWTAFGVMNVNIDGVDYSVNQNGVLAYQQTWNSPALPYGHHVVTFTTGTGGGSIDAVFTTEYTGN